MGSSDTYEALKRIYPYLHIKQKPASICLDFYKRYAYETAADAKEVIGEVYKAQLQEYQRKPGSGQKSAEALKTIRQKTESSTVKPEFQGKMHIVPPTIMLTENETAYIAGLLDADSSFLISKIHNRPSYLLEVKYRKFDHIILEYLAILFGGRVRQAPISSKNKVQPWLWLVGSQNAYRLIKHIYPYLRIKKKIAEICMEFFEQYWTGNVGIPISPKRQLIGEKYYAMLKGHLTKSMPHKKKIEIIADISL